MHVGDDGRRYGVVNLEPDLTGSGVGVSMRHRLLAALQGRPRDLVIDMRNVEHLSSEAVGVLVGVHARQRSRHRRLTLVCGDRSATQQALSRLGLRGSFRAVPEMPTPRAAQQRSHRPLGTPADGPVDDQTQGGATHDVEG